MNAQHGRHQRSAAAQFARERAAATPRHTVSAATWWTVAMEPTADEPDAALMETVKAVLDGDNSLLAAAHQLEALGAAAVSPFTTNVHLPNGLSADTVTRCIARRTQEAFETLLVLVGLGNGNHARLLLRPMVEDHIFLGWLQTLDGEIADQFVRGRAGIELLKGYQAQRDFLPEAYTALGVTDAVGRAPGLLMSLPDDALAEEHTKMKALGRGLGWKEDGPSVWKMAKAAELTDEYEFFYAASSRAVHANLHEMGRMVSGDSSTMMMSIGTESLEPIHASFALAYGVWMYDSLFATLARVRPELRETVDSPAWSVWLALVLAGLARNYHLPPIVTEREMRWS